VAERTNSLPHCFVFELTPFPMSLFKGLMRKPDKPVLYHDFTAGLTDAHLPAGISYVVDGGYTLHRVGWRAPADMRDILPLFWRFLDRLGSVVHVVFDGYDSGPSTKDQEHERRAANKPQTSPHRQIDINSKEISQQESFLSNVVNKTAFVAVLSKYLQHKGITVHQAPSDADTLIVLVALE
jgi:hypothetical protein